LIRAEVMVQHESIQVAQAIAKSVGPDNPKRRPRIVTRRVGRKTRTVISRARSVDSLIVTLNDLLSCIQSAEKAVTAVRKQSV
jgi:hypothetical protein